MVGVGGVQGWVFAVPVKCITQLQTKPTHNSTHNSAHNSRACTNYLITKELVLSSFSWYDQTC